MSHNGNHYQNVSPSAENPALVQAVLAGIVICGGVFLYLGFWQAFGAATSLGLYSILTAGIAASLALGEWLRTRRQPASCNSDGPPPPPRARSMEGILLIPVIAAVLVLYLQISILPYQPRNNWAAVSQYYCAAGFLLAAVLGWLAARQLSAAANAQPSCQQLAPWLRSWSVVAAVLAAATLLNGFGRTVEYRTIVVAIRYWTLGIAAWLLAEPLIRYWFSSASPEENTVPLELAILPLRLLFSRRIGVGDGYMPGPHPQIDSRSAWLWRTSKRLLGPAVIVLPFLLWLSTAAVVIQVNEEGILEHWGKLDTRSPLEPGLHLVWPWPIDRTKIYATRTVREMTIGYTGDTTARAMLWTRGHGGGEDLFLLGDGRERQELLAVNVSLFYRIGNVIQFAYSHQDPENALRILAYRTVLLETAGLALEDILTANRRGFRERIIDRLSGALAEEQLGVEIIDVAICSLHPPVAVAADYQAVVSAEIERKTRILEAEVERARTLPEARTRALTLVRKTEGNAIHRRLQVRGEAARFRQLQRAYAAAPDLFSFRQRLEALEGSLPGKRLVVIDTELYGRVAMLIDARPATIFGGEAQ